MVKLEELMPTDIKNMDYNQMIGLVKETNRPPGGYQSIFKIAQRAFLTKDSKILEIGTSTGITAIELARLVGCKIHAIDINPTSLEEAKIRAEQEGVSHLITFEVQDARQMTFANEEFDMVFCGNVTSLIPNREEALKEYSRVLKKGGFIAASPMYYVNPPSEELVRKVSEAIQVEIIPWDRQFWFDFFAHDNIHLYWYEDYKFDYIESDVVEKFVDDILKRDHLKQLQPETFAEVAKRYRDFMHLFRDNLSQMGYSLMLLRKENNLIEPELFTSTLIK